MNLQGVVPPITTPFANETVDHRALAANVERWMSTRLAGLVVLGSTGEAPLLEDSEADAVVDTVRQHVPRSRTLICGVGRESTAATIAAAKRAADLGVDAVLVRTPSYFKNVMTSDAFVRHFKAVADRSPVPVLLYNVTVYTGVNLLPDAVERLAPHGNIVGMKESGSDIVQLSETVARVPEDFVVLCGSAATFYAALNAGAKGGVLGVAAAIPEFCVEIFELVGAGKHAEAQALQRGMTPLGRMLGAQHGVAGLKYALDLLGYYGGPARSPLGAVPPEAQKQIQTLLDEIRGQTLSRSLATTEEGV